MLRSLALLGWALCVAVVALHDPAKTEGNKLQVLMETNDLLTPSTLAAVRQFNDVFNHHDVDAVMETMTDDCIFENTNPAPDGARYVGQKQVRAVWEKFFAANPDAHFEFVETIAAGDRCFVRWVYHKTKEGKPWHLCGVDIFRVRDGKIAEKLSYVKG